MRLYVAALLVLLSAGTGNAGEKPYALYVANNDPGAGPGKIIKLTYGPNGCEVIESVEVREGAIYKLAFWDGNLLIVTPGWLGQQAQIIEVDSQGTWRSVVTHPRQLISLAVSPSGDGAVVANNVENSLYWLTKRAADGESASYELTPLPLRITTVVGGGRMMDVAVCHDGKLLLGSNRDSTGIFHVSPHAPQLNAPKFQDYGEPLAGADWWAVSQPGALHVFFGAETKKVLVPGLSSQMALAADPDDKIVIAYRPRLQRGGPFRLLTWDWRYQKTTRTVPWALVEEESIKAIAIGPDIPLSARRE